MLFPILIIRFYAIGFIDGDPDFFMFNCIMESENELKAILCCHVVKPPNITIVTFTSLKNLIGNICSASETNSRLFSDMIGPGQPLNFDPGFTDAYVYGLYGLHRLINDATRIPHIRH